MMLEDRTPEQALQILLQGNPQERAEAVKFLGERQYAPAVPGLTQLVEEADPGTRYLAAVALGKLGDEAESAVPTLLQALRANDMYLRVAITGALIKIGEPSVPGLVKALFDRNKAVRRASAKALGKIGSPRAVNALKVTIKDPDPAMRRLSQEALERIQSS